MTTPQNELYHLSYLVKRLWDLFEPEQDDNPDAPRLNNIVENIEEIHCFIVEVLANQHRLENQMSLIIKLLSKNEKV